MSTSSYIMPESVRGASFNSSWQIFSAFVLFFGRALSGLYVSLKAQKQKQIPQSVSMT